MRRQGFTIIEVLVALLLLSLGLLGLAAATASSIRRIADGRWHVQATALGLRLLAAQGAAPCPAIGQGAVRHGPLTARWAVTDGAGEATRLVVVEVDGARPRGGRADTVASVHGC